MNSDVYMFIKYSVVGSLGTAIDLFIVILFVEVLNFKVIVAASIAFIFAATNNFFLNKSWTFKNKSKDTTHQYIKFILVSTTGLLLTIMFMYLLNVTLGVWYVFAKLITSLIVLSWNFICNKKWTFKEGFENEIIDNFNPHFKYSIIIPAYNEESRIIKTLNDIADFINKQKQQYEVIVVDDGSTDRTVGVVEGFQKKHRGISIIELSKNQGKGFAVKTGILNSKGENVLFLDADGSTHISEITKLVKHLSNNDIVIGSRKMNESVVVSPKSSLRKILSKLSVAISSLLVKDIKDTQCGFKLMNRKVALHLFSIQKIRKFGFDIEVLALAQFHNYKIAEIPIEWGHVAGSKVNFTRDSLRTFVEVIAIHYNFLTKRY